MPTVARRRRSPKRAIRKPASVELALVRSFHRLITSILDDSYNDLHYSDDQFWRMKSQCERFIRDQLVAACFVSDEEITAAAGSPPGGDVAAAIVPSRRVADGPA